MANTKHKWFTDRSFGPPIPIRVISKNLIEIEEAMYDIRGMWYGAREIPRFVTVDINRITSIEGIDFSPSFRDIGYLPNMLIIGYKGGSFYAFADKEHLTRLWAEYLAQKVYVKLEDLKHSIIQAE
jgi:hypothetical protein